jgi:hypothetical protein
MKLGSILRNINGEPEIGRVLLTTGVGASVAMPIVFQFLDMWHNGWHFDAVAWCAAYPGGLALLVTGGVVAIGRKERDVERARQTQPEAPA